MNAEHSLSKAGGGHSLRTYSCVGRQSGGRVVAALSGCGLGVLSLCLPGAIHANSCRHSKLSTFFARDSL